VLTTIQLIYKKLSLRWDSNPKSLDFEAMECAIGCAKKTAENVFKDGKVSSFSFKKRIAGL